MLEGTWKPDDAWWGMKEGMVVMAPYNKAMPAAADKIIAGWKDGSYDVFTGPISDQSGKQRLAKGERMKDADLAVIDWCVKGVCRADRQLPLSRLRERAGVRGRRRKRASKQTLIRRFAPPSPASGRRVSRILTPSVRAPAPPGRRAARSRRDAGGGSGR
jgi:hypothetical protein